MYTVCVFPRWLRTKGHNRRMWWVLHDITAEKAKGIARMCVLYMLLNATRILGADSLDDARVVVSEAIATATLYGLILL